MDRLELLKNDGYWSSKLNTMLYHKNYKGRGRRQELLKEILSLKNELIELCERKKKEDTIEQLEHDALLETVPYQLCPKCGGDGVILVQNWYGSPTSISSGVQTCDVCNGAKIIPQKTLVVWKGF